MAFSPKHRFLGRLPRLRLETGFDYSLISESERPFAHSVKKRGNPVRLPENLRMPDE